MLMIVGVPAMELVTSGAPGADGSKASTARGGGVATK
jgi:hypothetical protein